MYTFISTQNYYFNKQKKYELINFIKYFAY